MSLTCSYCAEAIEEGKEKLIGNYTLCPNCFETTTVCEDCGCLVYENDVREYANKTVCPACYQANTSVCEYCGEHYDTLGGHGWGGMCRACSDDHFECEQCGEIYHNDDYGENGMCQECCDKKTSAHIHCYHCDEPPLVFHPNQNESLYFGIELETENYSSRDGSRGECGEALFLLSDDERLFWLSEDCSLTCGIEIISQPCTLDYHRDSFPWQAILDTVDNCGGETWKGPVAALHIHFSKAFFGTAYSELYQLRLVYLFEKFYSNLAILGRASTYLQERSAKKYNNDLHNKGSKAKIRELKDYYRFQAVNLCNQDTVEIRIFRSAGTVKTILASIELVDFLARLATKTSLTAIGKLTWEGLLERISTKKYRFLPQYIDNLKRAGKL